jgi:YfiH family protein
MITTFPEFADIPGLRHIISTREGGVSCDGYATLNLGYHVGDDPAAVTENRRRLGVAAGYDPTSLIAAQQVHGTDIAWVGADERGRGAFSWDTALPATDALLTAQVGLPLAIQVADCAPVLLVDAAQHVLAVAHAGWRGALGGIVSACVRRMIVDAGSRPEEIRVGIGPTLCPACLEVGHEVAEQVAARYGESTVLRGADKPHLDIQAMIAADLRAVGVPSAHIVHHPDCTRCRNERFFSHRGQHGVAGRFALIAWWER